MPRYVLELPRSWDEKLVALATDEGVPPRILLHWLLAKGIHRTDAIALKKRMDRSAHSAPKAA